MTGVSGLFSLSDPSRDGQEAGLDQRVKPFEWDVRKDMRFDVASARKILEPKHSCPRVTRAKPLFPVKRKSGSTPKRQRSVMSFRERLFQPTRRGGSAREPERMRASEPIDRSGWR